MGERVSILCTICARGGSVGVKNKNLRELCGKPLIAHSIIQAKAAGCFDAVVVSSDSDEILEVSRQYGADFVLKRPDEMATSHAPKIPVIQHAVSEAELHFRKQFSIVVDLDSTSPLRVVEDILGAIRLVQNAGVENVITGTPAHRSPYFNLVEVNDSGSVTLSKKLETPVSRRQDSPKCYDMNASIYVWQRAALDERLNLFGQDSRLYEMPAERSWDIDSELDFKIVSCLAQDREDLWQ